MDHIAKAATMLRKEKQLIENKIKNCNRAIGAIEILLEIAPRSKRRVSAAGRRRMAQAQRERWARLRKEK